MQHTEISLQEAIKKALEKDVIPNISIFKTGEMQVHLQDIPLSTEYEKLPEYEDDDDFDSEIDRYLPCFIVKLRGAEKKSASDVQVTTVETIVIIKDWSKDMSGYKTLMICLNRLRDYFYANAGIDGKFRLMYPVKFVVNEEAAIPYFIGSITTSWATETMGYNDTYGFL